MKRIYIGGKLNDDAVGYIKNLHEMCQWAERVRKAGFAVFIPGLDFLIGLVHGNWDYADYFDNSQPWLDASDAVFMAPNWIYSKGCQREIERAGKVGIPVFFTIESLLEWAEEN